MSKATSKHKSLSSLQLARKTSPIVQASVSSRRMYSNKALQMHTIVACAMMALYFLAWHLETKPKALLSMEHLFNIPSFAVSLNDILAGHFDVCR